MAELSRSQGSGGSTRSGISRRTFLKHGGTSAVGAALLEAGAAQAAVDGSMQDDANEVLGPGLIPIDLTINGRRVPVQAEPATTLVDVLRNHLGLTGTKIGCDRGACSACTVWLDGQPASSCMTLALDARGRNITTIEGLAEGGKLHPVQQAFIEHDALQCGFCTPGMVMSCAALIDRKPDAGIDEVKAAISGHLCRCGTYPNIFAAVLAVAGENRRRGT
ncbi:(2Fe-2S)-binding protein [Mesorhizobium muleiense]|uniref:Xanthine dehydrogenase YagT iron-sulfur-binding subunit n=1 Tax=Mesorhizobium muleiense TaxID=1004279 RepID=A0A1G9D1K6_9HYPH|nr:(2Fe-2S)-binding protein [Mesorhizobium muleiense]MCF6102705.1 (2Fe-2S)-binding protein [Mesorhizobium muleiense]SDK57811.1 xanthine dehydrogenase YagT iron-sulfur-binding subunit [Mesorhizobium muleiense]